MVILPGDGLMTLRILDTLLFNHFECGILFTIRSLVPQLFKAFCVTGVDRIIDGVVGCVVSHRLVGVLTLKEVFYLYVLTI
mgnify:CR=1 FL=1|jgi:hypothetical protein